jgi:HEAT repeat protein
MPLLSLADYQGNGINLDNYRNTISRAALGSLCKIAATNSELWDKLEKFFIKNQLFLIIAAEFLPKNAKNYPKLINSLTRLARTANDEDLRRQAAVSLEMLDPGNSEAIKVLAQLINSANDEDLRRQAAVSLMKINTGNLETIEVLIQLASNTNDRLSLFLVVFYLGRIDPSSEARSKAMTVLTHLVDNADDEDLRRQAAVSLETLDSGNLEAIKVLTQLARFANNQSVRKQAAFSLGKIDPGNSEAITILAELYCNADDSEAAWSLNKILTTEKSMQQAVVELRDILSDESSQKNPVRFEKCYEIIWKCAQNLSYPDFYRAWHSPTNSISSPETT